MKEVPNGFRYVICEDDLVYVYDSKAQVVYSGPLDYCPYKDDFSEHGEWNERDGNYDLPHGYKLVVK